MSRVHHLPQPLTSFIGRQRELADATDLLSNTRLLTLTGPGGCGKTRLALEVASRLVAAFPDGVWWVELSALTDPVLLPQTVASRLGLKESGRRPTTESLTDFLRAKSLLLVLDTCEHLLSESAVLAHALLTDIRGLRVLATSRELLDVPGEVIYRVPSLSVPDRRGQPGPLTALLEYESVRLFVERATARRPGLVLTDADTPALAEVCQRLDGIPLAIELAAARMHVLSVQLLAERLREQFQVLAGSSPVILPRHRTLRKAFEWSHDLLNDEERTLFRRVSVFAGGFTFEAAEAVCAARLELLGRLVDKSMIQTDPSGRVVRYRLLDLMREFGREKLAMAGETDLIRQRHREFFLRLAQEAEPHLISAAEQEWEERLDAEHDNLRVALEWPQPDADITESNLRSAAAVRRFWFVRGYLAEGRLWLERGLKDDATGSSPARAKALNAAASLAWRQGDFVQARTWAAEALDLAKASGDQREVANALHELGTIAQMQNDYATAKRLLGESLALRRDLGMIWHAGIALNNLGDIAYSEEDFQQAADFFADGLALFEEIGNPSGMAWTSRNLGAALSRLGMYAESLASFRRGLELHQRLGYHYGIAAGLDGLAASAARQSRSESAAWILGAADALHERVGIPRQRPMVAELDQVMGAARAALGEAAYAAAWARGRELPLEHVLNRILAGDPFHGTLTPLQVRLLGGFEVRREGVVLPASVWRRRRNRLLFVYLLLARKAVPREELLEALWPDLSPAAARASLNVAWSNLKRSFEPDLPDGGTSNYLTIERGRYVLQPGSIVTDVADFESQVADAATAARPAERAAALEAAASIYAGDLLPDDANEPWTVVARERLHTQYLGVLESLAESRHQQGRTEEALATLRTILHLEPWREETCRSLMEMLIVLGRRSEALRVYRECEALLRRELNVAPSPETRALADLAGTGDRTPGDSLGRV